ncbi:MAG: hypothetical protein Q9175_008106 [Cornicularia normoerica]
MLMSMLVFVVALIWSTFPAIDSDCLFPKFDSLHVQSPADFLNGFPLPHRINTTVHEAVLNEVRDSETLSNLILTRSEVCSSLNVTSRELIGRFACATKMYSYSDSKHAELTFLDEITVAHKQLSYTVSNVSYLSNLYHSIGPAYYTLVSAAVEALEAVQLSDFKRFAISAQPFSFKMAGLDATKLYWDPWIEKAKKLKEARLGIVVLEREMQRLEQIAQMVQEVDRNFERLPAAVVQGDKKWLEQKRDQLFAVVEWVAHVGQNWRKGIKLARGGESRQKWLKEWFRQHLAQHIVQDGEAVTDKKLDSWWANLDCGCRA